MFFVRILRICKRSAVLLLLPLFLHNPAMTQTETTWFDLNEALKHPDLVYRLDLSHQNLKTVPLSLCKLTHLKRLDLSHNQLREIPAVVLDSLKDLRRLHLDHNYLVKLPSTLYSLENLKKLYLAANQLEELPPDIAKLQQLKRLTIDQNKIKTVPDTLFALEQLEWLEMDDEIFLNLSPDLSLDSYEIITWRCIQSKPDSIAGRPLSYYLNHPDIDPYSKLFVQGRYALHENMARCVFIDSLFTENEETAPFYAYLYFDILTDKSSYQSYLADFLCPFKDRLLRERPCLYLEGLMKYRSAYSCVDEMTTISEQEHAWILRLISEGCPDLLKDRTNLYFRYLNYALPNELKKGVITIRITQDKNESDTLDFRASNTEYVVVLSDSTGGLVDKYGWARVDAPVHFYRILPGKYMLRVFYKEHYANLSERYLNNSVDYADRRKRELSGSWLAEIEDGFFYKADVQVASINDLLKITIPEKALSELMPDSLFGVQENTVVHYEMPVIDMEHHSRISGSECDALYNRNDSLNLKLFMKEVYLPAKGNAQVSPANIAFLEAIKQYLIQRVAVSRDSISHLPFPLAAVYRFGSYEEQMHRVSMLDYRSYNDWSEDGLSPLYLNYQYRVSPDSTFYSDFIRGRINVYYENGALRPYRLTKFQPAYDACQKHGSYPLYEVDTLKDAARPVFASTHKFELEFRKDAVVDKWLELMEKCYHSYCDSSIPHHSFARLKGVPQLIFTTKTQDDWMNRYPGRGLYMKLNDGRVIELWYEEFEYVECSCI